MLKKIFGIILITAAQLLPAQNPLYKILNKQSGLPTNTVYSILYAKSGFVYVGTDKGLCRYDGKTFKVIQTKSGKHQSVTKLIEVENGDIYFQTFSGELQYFHNDTVYDENKIKPCGNFYKMQKTKPFLYLCNQKEIIIFNYIDKSIDKISAPKYFLQINCLYRNQLITVDESQNIVKIKNKNSIEVIAKNKPLEVSFVEANNNKLVLLKKTGNKNFQYVSNGELKEIDGIKEDVFINNIEIIDNEFWICTSNGLYILDSALVLKNHSKSLFQNYNITGVNKDNENSYWISTLDNGILYVPNISVQYYTYNNYKWSCINQGPTSKELILGTTTNQLAQYNLKTKIFETISDAGYDNEVTSCIYNKDMQHYVFGSKDLIFVKNKQIVKAERNYAVKKIQLFDDKLLFGYANGASYMYDKALGYKKPNYDTTVVGVNGINRCDIIKTQNGFRCRDIVCNKKDSSVYLAFSNGLFCKSNHIATQIKFKGQEIQANCLELSDNEIFISTNRFGILKYNIKSKYLESLLPNINAGKLKTDGSNLIMITEYGLIVYNLNTKQINLWDVSKGIDPQADLKDLLILKDTCYIASSEGLITLPYKHYQKNTSKPKFVITSLTLNNQLSDKSITTKYGENNITINYATLAYKHEDSTKLFYKLNNNAWQQLSTINGELRLSSLSPDVYHISFKVINEDGIESVFTNEITIIIKPLFYQTWWFISLLVILGVMLGLIINRIRLKRVLKKQQLAAEKILLKHQLELSQLKTLRSQMNPHFIFNALNTLQSHIYSGNSEEAKDVLNLFSDLSRAMLSNSENLEVSIREEMELVKLYLELEQKRLPKINYQISIDPGVDTLNIHIPAMLIQPLVENSVKHGISNKAGNGHIKINIYKQEVYVVFEIDDDGIGRLASQAIKHKQNSTHVSFSTNASVNRIEILNKNNIKKIKLEIIDKENAEHKPSGTLVKLFIPENYD